MDGSCKTSIGSGVLGAGIEYAIGESEAIHIATVEREMIAMAMAVPRDFTRNHCTLSTTY
jgi:hypothetical protein